ncbi:MAG: hypothetical protein QM744_11670 [Mesorhizobium sp.]
MSGDDSLRKTRLISKTQIAEAILSLAEGGIPFDQWLTALTDKFYVDLDELHEIMALPAIRTNHLAPEL